MEKLTLDQCLGNAHTPEEVKYALELFVKYGVLRKTKKNGEDAYINDNNFVLKSPLEQQEIFERIQKEEINNPINP